MRKGWTFGDTTNFVTDPNDNDANRIETCDLYLTGRRIILQSFILPNMICLGSYHTKSYFALINSFKKLSMNVYFYFKMFRRSVLCTSIRGVPMGDLARQ